MLLDTHERDHLIAFDVCKALLTSGVRPDLIAQEDAPGLNSSLFAERLGKTRGLIVLFGRASEEWVHARLDEGRKLMVPRIPAAVCGSAACCWRPRAQRRQSRSSTRCSRPTSSTSGRG